MGTQASSAQFPTPHTVRKWALKYRVHRSPRPTPSGSGHSSVECTDPHAPHRQDVGTRVSSAQFLTPPTVRKWALKHRVHRSPTPPPSGRGHSSVECTGSPHPPPSGNGHSTVERTVPTPRTVR